MELAQVIQELRSSDCSTAMFRPDVASADLRGIDNGYTEGGVAISLLDKTYTRARIAPQKNAMPATGNPVVDFRLCAWDYETKELRATTANLASMVNALPRGATFDAIEIKPLIEADFLEPLYLREGEWVILGDALYGDYPSRNISISSMNCRKSMMQLAPQLGFNNKADVVPPTQPGEFPTGGYTGGTPGPVGSYVSGNYPWMDLL